ncbi:hypothetical protein ACH4M4_24025 [Streptomyces sp. NPDC017254]|uniref:hypothetical protein n=1 Tax=unclassified Streptomyces TaxID=2593676 RepID=UPI0037A53A19
MRDPQTPERSEEPLPHDREDQQATDGEDPLAIPVPDEDLDDSDGPDDAGRGTRLPDTDEAGTGPRGRPGDATVHPEHPLPHEPTG